MSDKEKELIKKVFATDAGQDLLELWYKLYVVSPLFHPDTNTMYTRIGQHEFVTQILTEYDGDIQ